MCVMGVAIEVVSDRWSMTDLVGDDKQQVKVVDGYRVTYKPNHSSLSPLYSLK